MLRFQSNGNGGIDLDVKYDELKWRDYMECNDEVTFEIGRPNVKPKSKFIGATVCFKLVEQTYLDPEADDDGEEVWAVEITPINPAKPIPWPIKVAYKDWELSVEIDCPEDIRVRCTSMRYEDVKGKEVLKCPVWTT